MSNNAEVIFIPSPENTAPHHKLAKVKHLCERGWYSIGTSQSSDTSGAIHILMSPELQQAVKLCIRDLEAEYHTIRAVVTVHDLDKDDYFIVYGLVCINSNPAIITISGELINQRNRDNYEDIIERTKDMFLRRNMYDRYLEEFATICEVNKHNTSRKQEENNHAE